MKRFPFWLIALLTTFSSGILFFAVWHFYSTPIDVEVPAPRVVNRFSAGKLPFFPGRSITIDSINLDKDSYFPEKLLAGDFLIGDRAANRRYYTSPLKKMDEPSLPVSVEKDAEIYRFFWLPNLLHETYPMIFKVERQKNKFQLTFKELGMNGGNYDKVTKNQTRFLSEYESGEFLALLEDTDYWKLPNNQTPTVLDGAQWILEGVRENRYHVVDRTSPENGDFKAACLYLLKLSGAKIEESDLY